MKNRTDRYDEELVVEDVHFLGPPLDRVVAGVRQLRHEEGVEGVHLLELLRAPSGHDHLKVRKTLHLQHANPYFRSVTYPGHDHLRREKTLHLQHANPDFQISDIHGMYFRISVKKS